MAYKSKYIDKKKRNDPTSGLKSIKINCPSLQTDNIQPAFKVSNKQIKMFNTLISYTLILIVTN